MSKGHDVLHIYTVYKNPRDYPGKYVVRRSTIGLGKGLAVDPLPLAVEATLQAVRGVIPNYCVRLDRQQDDDPVIFEVWL